MSVAERWLAGAFLALLAGFAMFLGFGWLVTQSYFVREDLLIDAHTFRNGVSHGEALEDARIINVEAVLRALGATVAVGPPLLVHLNGKVIAVGTEPVTDPVDARIEIGGGLKGSWPAGEFMRLVQAAYPSALLERVQEETRAKAMRVTWRLRTQDWTPITLALQSKLAERGGHLLCDPGDPVFRINGRPQYQGFYRDRDGGVRRVWHMEYPWGGDWRWSAFDPNTSSEMSHACSPAKPNAG